MATIFAFYVTISIIGWIQCFVLCSSTTTNTNNNPTVYTFNIIFHIITLIVAMRIAIRSLGDSHHNIDCNTSTNYINRHKEYSCPDTQQPPTNSPKFRLSHRCLFFCICIPYFSIHFFIPSVELSHTIRFFCCSGGPLNFLITPPFARPNSPYFTIFYHHPLLLLLQASFSTLLLQCWTLDL